MAYIESDTALPGHHKTKRAARLLGCSRSQVIGCLHCLWAWALTNAPTGDLTGFTADEIAEEADWSGDPPLFIAALIECGKPDADGNRGPGFLERLADGHTIIHHWYEHGGGKLVEHRNQDAYKAWLRRNRLQDSEENYRAWQTRAAAPRRVETPDLPPPAPVVPTSSDVGRNLFLSDDVGRCSDIDNSSRDKRSVDNSSNSKEGSVRGDSSADMPTGPPGEPGPSAGAAFAAQSKDTAALTNLLSGAGVNQADAERLARDRPEECHRQLLYLPYVSPPPNSAGAWLRSAIEGGYAAPPGYAAAIERQKREAQDVAKRGEQRAANEAQRAHEAAVDAAMKRVQADDPELWNAIRVEANARLPDEIRAMPTAKPLRLRTLESQIRMIVAMEHVAAERTGI